MLGIVSKFVSTAAVMSARIITGGDAGARGSDDIQVGGRVWIDIGDLHRAVPVAGPEMPIRGDQNPVRTGAVGRRGSTTDWQRSGHAGHAADEDVVFGVDDVHAEIRSVGEIV